MRLIIGGAYQGKAEYAVNMYGLWPKEIVDCEHFEPKDFDSLKCVCNYHCFIKNQLQNGADIIKITSEIISGNPELIIIMDEVGSGIIPMERFERKWREAVGRTGCYLAAHAESVERIVCGYGVRLK